MPCVTYHTNTANTSNTAVAAYCYNSMSMIDTPINNGPGQDFTKCGGSMKHGLVICKEEIGAVTMCHCTCDDHSWTVELVQILDHMVLGWWGSGGMAWWGEGRQEEQGRWQEEGRGEGGEEGEGQGGKGVNGKGGRGSSGGTNLPPQPH